MKRGVKARSRKKKRFPVMAAVAAGVLIVGAAAVSAGIYIYEAKKYENVFFPNTVINGMDVSKKTVEEVKTLIGSGIDGYTLTLKQRSGDTETIVKDDIRLHSVFDGSLETMLEAQEIMKWWEHRKKTTSHEIETMIAYDEKALQEKVYSFNGFSPDAVQLPQNARLSEYVSGQGYSVIPEVQGNELVKETVVQGVADAIQNLKGSISLEEINAYTKPQVTSDDEELIKLMNNLNKHVGVTVTYQFGDRQEVLSGDTINFWIRVNADKTIALNRDAVAAYVKELASKYNTAYKKKELKTSYGETVTISSGFYGWRINQHAETEELYKIIRSGESQTREPVYLQRAASHGTNDYGNTYVEINLTAQHLFFYKDGELLIEADLVSGNQTKEYETPAGAFPLNYKERNATLNGEDYATPVSYWMPFNGNIGMHDASWRSSFGGSIYKTNGSHGCVNLPPSAAKTIYENISPGMPVLCYYLEGTQSGKTSAVEKETTSETTKPTSSIPAAPKPTTMPETIPQETTQAAETAPTVPETSPVPQNTTEAVNIPDDSGEVEETTKKNIGPGE